VDGGLVANLPIELALQEGADVIVASYLGATDLPAQSPADDNALNVANRMLKILIRQNERRSIAQLRPQDILVQPDLNQFSFESFDQSAAIIARGDKAVQLLDDRFRALATDAPDLVAQQAAPTRPEDQPRKPVRTIRQLEVTGNHTVPASFVRQALQPLMGQKFDADKVAQKIDALYVSGYFERISYQIGPASGDADKTAPTSEDCALIIDVNEKTYGPTFLKTSLGFFSETNGNNQYSLGVGLRRPWLTEGGLELQLDASIGSQSELSARLFQSLGSGFGTSTYASYNSNSLPLYRPDVTDAQVMASATLRKQELGLKLTYDFDNLVATSLGLISSQTALGIDTPRDITFGGASGAGTAFHLDDASWSFTGLNAQITIDQLDAPSFPTRGYYLNMEAAQGINDQSQYSSYRSSARWASSRGPHILNLGAESGSDHELDCTTCTATGLRAPLYLGGFQAMGAYHLAQLNGDRLLHMQATYMYRLSEGGVFHQPTYVGWVTEAGDAWLHINDMSLKRSNTLFAAVDSKIGDIFLGIAAGSDGNRNIFFQLGRRFSPW